MTTDSIKNLAAATLIRAVRDYFGRRATPKSREHILKDLCSEWMQTLTNGTSANVAEQLEKHPKEIKARLHKYIAEMEEEL